jgi:hypothetical protein
VLDGRHVALEGHLAPIRDGGDKVALNLHPTDRLLRSNPPVSMP